MTHNTKYFLQLMTQIFDHWIYAHHRPQTNYIPSGPPKSPLLKCEFNL